MKLTAPIFCIQAAPQVGDEVTKDEPITTNPNVGGFGQDGFGWGDLNWRHFSFALLRTNICWVLAGYTPSEFIFF